MVREWLALVPWVALCCGGCTASVDVVAEVERITANKSPVVYREALLEYQRRYPERLEECLGQGRFLLVSVEPDFLKIMSSRTDFSVLLIEIARLTSMSIVHVRPQIHEHVTAQFRGRRSEVLCKLARTRNCRLVRQGDCVLVLPPDVPRHADSATVQRRFQDAMSMETASERRSAIMELEHDCPGSLDMFVGLQSFLHFSRMNRTVDEVPDFLVVASRANAADVIDALRCAAPGKIRALPGCLDREVSAVFSGTFPEVLESLAHLLSIRVYWLPCILLGP